MKTKGLAYLVAMLVLFCAVTAWAGYEWPNVLYGLDAGKSLQSGSNTFIGVSAGQSTTTGDFNTFIGRNAGYSNVTGFSNIFIGEFAGYNNISTSPGGQRNE